MENKKSKSLRVASWLVGLIGVGACLIAAVAYLLMHQFGYQIKFIGAFQWQHLLYVGAAALVFIIVAVILRIASNVAAKKKAAAEEVNCVEEEEDECCCEDESCEACEACESCEAAAEEDAPKKCKICEAVQNKLSPENREKLIGVVKKNAPVIIAVAATATAAVVIGKIVSDSKKAKIRRNLLDLIY